MPIRYPREILCISGGLQGLRPKLGHAAMPHMHKNQAQVSPRDEAFSSPPSLREHSRLLVLGSSACSKTRAARAQPAPGSLLSSAAMAGLPKAFPADHSAP